MPGIYVFEEICIVPCRFFRFLLGSAARNKDDTPGPCQYTPINPNVISERRSIGEKTGVMLVIVWQTASDNLNLSNALVAIDVYLGLHNLTSYVTMCHHYLYLWHSLAIWFSIRFGSGRLKWFSSRAWDLLALQTQETPGCIGCDLVNRAPVSICLLPPITDAVDWRTKRPIEAKSWTLKLSLTGLLTVHISKLHFLNCYKHISLIYCKGRIENYSYVFSSSRPTNKPLYILCLS